MLRLSAVTYIVTTMLSIITLSILGLFGQGTLKGEVSLYR
jgi:hypothetical protein